MMMMMMLMMTMMMMIMTILNGGTGFELKVTSFKPHGSNKHCAPDSHDDDDGDGVAFADGFKMIYDII